MNVNSFGAHSGSCSSYSSLSSNSPGRGHINEPEFNGHVNAADDDDDGADDDTDKDIDEDGEEGKREFFVRDEMLVQNVEFVMGILHGFGSDGLEAKHKLEQCGMVVTSELVVEVLSRVRNDWEAAFTFFAWAGKQPGYAHSVRVYHSMISILGKMRKFDTAWSLINEMRGVKNGESLVTPQTLLIVIRKYCAVHDVGKAISTFHALRRFKFEIGIEEFQDLLCALCRYKNVEDAEHLLCSNENVFPFNTKSFNIVLNGWCNMLVNMAQAKRFWREMERRGIARDVVSYSSMISCYSKVGSLNDVLKLFNKMKELEIDPDRKVYNAVIFALAKGRLVKEARNLLTRIEEKGLKPNIVTYNSLIKPLCKARKIDEANQVLDEMLERGLSPSIVTYHAFFGILRSEKEVFDMLEKMKKSGCPPTNDTYIMLIRKFCRWRQIGNVFKLWNEMSKAGVSPDRSSYIVLIHGLFLNGKLEEASKYYEEMKEKGFLPEPKTDEMLKAWLENKQMIGSCNLEHSVDKAGFNPSYKSQRITSSTSFNERNFLKQPETRRVSREKGFSFWEK
ncbi:hypothetical protein Sjap_001242 [Stephania japonica]|uniref:Pentatricopeptide repeat-containing protein n=1 Tax=Stephania japonica TaxID=461633 RepID=A0AAP0KJL0_9MAGN